MNLIEKIEAKLIELGIVEMAKAPVTPEVTDSGATEATSGETVSGLPTVIVTEFVPKNGKISYSAIGAPVLSIDADGKETPAEDGEYNTTEGKTITVVDGKLTKEVDTPEMETEEVEATSGTTELHIEVQEIELAKYPWDKCQADMKKQGYSQEAADKICGKIKATNMSEEDFNELNMAMGLEGQRLKDIIDMTKNGDYTLSLSVKDGVVTYGSVYASTYQNLLMEEEKKAELKLEELTKGYERIIETLKTGEVRTPDRHKDVETKPLTKVDIVKMQLAEARNKEKNL